MEDDVIQLYPEPSRRVPFEGLYIAENLRSEAEKLGRPFVYTNYIQSLDGRIAIPDPNGSGMMVPEQIKNDRDWRLFQELAVQSDIIITSGRYLRDYNEGKAQEILRVHEDPRFEDLHAWREACGLALFPDLVVISASLKFALPEALIHDGRKVIIATTESADRDRMRELEAHPGCDLLIAGEKMVSGKPLVMGLAERGYTTIFNSTGPKVNHLLLQDQRLDRFYLTFALRALGGHPISTVVEGPLFDPPLDFKLRSLYLDEIALNGAGQLLSSFDRLER